MRVRGERRRRGEREGKREVETQGEQRNEDDVIQHARHSTSHPPTNKQTVVATPSDR